jgi:hypothetical protein
MHSRHARNLYDYKLKIIFEIAWALFEIILFIHFYLLKKALGLSQKHFNNKFYKGLMNTFGPPKNSIFMHGFKSVISAFLKNCQNGTF